MLLVATFLILLQQVTGKIAAASLWGPGLEPDRIALPCRYFFLQLLDADGRNITDSHHVTLDISISGHLDAGVGGGGDGACRAWTEVMNRNDGVFMVRYKLFLPCQRLVISVKSGDRQLAEKRVENISWPDSCDCPLSSLQEWYESVGCVVDSAQIMEDLRQFSQGVNFSQHLEQAIAAFKNPGAYAWCHYVLKAGFVYRKCYGEHVGFSMFWDAILGWLARKGRLPDLEMMVNLGDWPLVKRQQNGAGLAMFSWCGSKDTADIVLPTYEITEASLECMGRQSLDVLSAMGKNSKRWEEKTDELFWRGRDSRLERLALVELAQSKPELKVNASITAYFFFREEEKRLGRGKHVSFFQFFDHKYQINIDGTVAAYRFPYLLAGNSVVLKQDSQYFEHFYRNLQPWTHYIPIKEDLSDLKEKLEWAREHEIEVRSIVRNAQQFVLDHLLPLNVFCYHAKLLLEWAKLLREPVEIREGMSLVETALEEKRYPRCSCQQQQGNGPSSKDEF